MAKQRFTFDDEDVIDNPKQTVPQEPSQPKRKLNKKRVFMVVAGLFLIGAIALAVIIFTGGNDGPAYGERCANLLEVDADKIVELENKIMETKGIKSVEIEADCRIIKFTYEFNEGTSTSNVKKIVEKTLHQFDDGLGYPEVEDSKWSQLLNKSDGRRQYDIELVLKVEGNDDFPAFGTKHAGVEEITYTTQSVVDQKSTDKALARQAEVDAANKKAAEESN